LHYRRDMMTRRTIHRAVCAAVGCGMALVLASCGGTPVPPAPVSPPRSVLKRLGFTIQAGAFTHVDNAVRLTERLTACNLDAYYFVYQEGLYKVRFGDFATRDAARRTAEEMMAAGVIREFYIVRPEDHAVNRADVAGDRYLREQIVATARRFVGVPYKWGGTSAARGFDCSGLAMVVYKLNGLDLPRSSREQYRRGDLVTRKELKEGDLVFFDTQDRGRVSHVGVYIGKGRFIHAPGRGKNVCMESLSTRYFVDRYYGAKTYI